MQSQPDYELIDLGHGRKLESFGGVIVDRPCPAANCQRGQPNAWESAKLIYEASSDRAGRWRSPHGGSMPDEPWTVLVPCSFPANIPSLRLIVRPQASGQLGLFPEHWQQWTWFHEQIERWRNSRPKTSSTHPAPRVLHLFAYTGATTLALAAMGAEVTHVDAMRSAVSWARDNSQSSQLDSLPIRWIVDDARAYVERERKRGKTYDFVLLDPPSYGHGATGKDWIIGRDLEPLLRSCTELMSTEGYGIVLTGHSLDIDPQRLHSAVCKGPKFSGTTLPESSRAVLKDRSGRNLDCGYVARFLTGFPSRSPGKR